MDSLKWGKIENILDKFEIKPMVGIIPNNSAENLIRTSVDNQFWRKVQSWIDKGYTIALHGYNHRYISSSGLKGLNPMWERSEFSGISLDMQRAKIRDGVKILRKNGINPKYFFAPSHTYDENTLEALRLESDIRVINDSIGRFPYKKNDFIFIPQVVGHCMKMPIRGIWTFCLHPNVMKESDFVTINRFISDNKESFIGFGELDLSMVGKKKILDHILSHIFFSYRKFRGLK